MGHVSTSSSDQESEDESNDCPPQKRSKKEPPLDRIVPKSGNGTSSLADWKPPELRQTVIPTPKSRPDNDPKGRIRSFPHVAGNFPTHVYVPVQPDKLEQQRWRDAAEEVRKIVPELEYICGGDGSKNCSASKTQGQACNVEYHVSLSHTVPIKYGQIEPFVGFLREALQDWSGAELKVGKDFEVFVNDEGTRTFLSLPISKGRPQLINATVSVDKVFGVEGFRRFYKDPKPHISIAWLLGDQRNRLEAALTALRKHASFVDLLRKNKKHQVDKVVCRAGCYVYNVWKKSA
eukprot:jgi/Botrbrau1/20984/Bobra.0144s0003.1